MGEGLGGHPFPRKIAWAQHRTLPWVQRQSSVSIVINYPPVIDNAALPNGAVSVSFEGVLAAFVNTTLRSLKLCEMLDASRLNLTPVCPHLTCFFLLLHCNVPARPRPNAPMLPLTLTPNAPTQNYSHRTT